MLEASYSSALEAIKKLRAEGWVGVAEEGDYQCIAICLRPPAGGPAKNLLEVLREETGDSYYGCYLECLARGYCEYACHCNDSEKSSQASSDRRELAEACGIIDFTHTWLANVMDDFDDTGGDEPTEKRDYAALAADDRRLYGEQ